MDETNEYGCLAAVAADGKLAWERTVETRVFHVADGTVCTGSLSDTGHDMRVAMRLDLTGTITAVGAEMARFPFGSCPEAPGGLAGVVGLNVTQPGLLRLARQAVPKAGACTHLKTVVDNMLRVLVLVWNNEDRDAWRAQMEALDPEERRVWSLRTTPGRQGQCVSFVPSEGDEPLFASARTKLEALFGEAVVCADSRGRF